MKSIITCMLLVLIAGFGLVGCKSIKTGGSAKKAEELRKSGAAGDMGEAQRMADDYYWVEKAKQKEEAARQERQKAAQKK